MFVSRSMGPKYSGRFRHVQGITQSENHAMVMTYDLWETWGASTVAACGVQNEGRRRQGSFPLTHDHHHAGFNMASRLFIAHDDDNDNLSNVRSNAQDTLS